VEREGRWVVEGGTLGPVPYRDGGPPIWSAGSLPASLERAGRRFDGWLPNAPDAGRWREQWAQVQAAARAAGRDPGSLVGAMYLTAAVDENAAAAAQRLDAYLEQYYGRPAAEMRARQACYAGPPDGLAAWLQGYANAGANHLVVRVAGDHERHLALLANLRRQLGW
jgi:alkanesulfonate monooxygenase SsuD/methylene tetrahydromethanopterin reductase-like flavin-dependent oxidoreductase (luciferase family)